MQRNWKTGSGEDDSLIACIIQTGPNGERHHDRDTQPHKCERHHILPLAKRDSPNSNSAALFYR
jgi:hypothetical protein